MRVPTFETYAMPLDRRNLLLSIGALATLRGISAFPKSANAAQPITATSPADGAATRLLAAAAEELLAEYPENATFLGLDRDARAGLKYKLTDRSPEGVAHAAEAAAARFKKLDTVDRGQLGTASRRNIEVFAIAHRLALEGYRFRDRKSVV